MTFVSSMSGSEGHHGANRSVSQPTAATLASLTVALGNSQANCDSNKVHFSDWMELDEKSWVDPWLQTAFVNGHSRDATDAAYVKASFTSFPRYPQSIES